jgi:hypothetical protein
MREDTGMHPVRDDRGPLVPAARWRRLARAIRAILRPRATSLSWGAGRVLAGATVAAGVIAQALLGWRWWVVVAVLTVAGEAAIVGSTLARSAEREELIDELVAALAPRRYARRRTRRALERFRAAPFPVYGLPPSWSGPRFLGGWAIRRDRGSGAERTTSVRLGHGDRDADYGPLLLVEVDAGVWPRLGRPDLAERLNHAAAGTSGAAAGVGRGAGPGRAASVSGRASRGPRRSGAGPDARPGGWAAGRASGPADGSTGERANGPTGDWAAGPAEAVPAGTEAGAERVEIPVDGEPVAFEVLGDGRRWVAQGEQGDLVVTLEARDLPLAEVRLVRITDVEPYLAGPHAW